MRGCKSLLESIPSNELSLGARPLGDCGPHGFALHQEAREWEEEVGPDLPTLSAMQAGHSIQAASTPAKVTLLPLPLEASCLAMQVLYSHRCRTMYWKKGGLTAPLCIARCLLCSMGWGGEAATHPFLVQTVTPATLHLRGLLLPTGKVLLLC